MDLRVSSGIGGLDNIIDSLRLGDNVVWQVTSIDEYITFAQQFCRNAEEAGRKIIYMRFANHKPILNDKDKIIRYELDASDGFESFSIQIHKIIAKEGKETFYVFDCLSDLLLAWATDLMVGNFFKITCPYLFELDTIAYFAIYRNNHSFETIARIRETTQILIDLYEIEDKIYIHPLKVWNRYSNTMFLPHIINDNDFTAVTSSVDAAKLISHVQQPGTVKSKRKLDTWDRMFMNAEDVLINAQKGDKSATQQIDSIKEKLCKAIIGHEKDILNLAVNNISLEQLLTIKSRIIGSGYIGGKAAGMLVARAVLENNKDFEWHTLLEPHDSYYIGTDVFYTYLVENGWWKLRLRQKTQDEYYSAASELEANMLQGLFPADIQEQFKQMLEYFGQSPIIVRSSSLLEDSFGNAFAGKYESVFCVNQGSPSQRYNEFLNAVRTVYASCMSRDALEYRRKRGLDESDEQMALLVQRVSGSYHGKYFYPDLAGVGNSYNSYVWNSNIDPYEGMLRLVFGLGTRAVDRIEDDYPRVIAVDKPFLQPYSDMDDKRRYSQHYIDLLDVSDNNKKTININDLEENDSSSIQRVAQRDTKSERRMRELGLEYKKLWVLTFDTFLKDSPLINLFSNMLKDLEKGYNYPVDIEYTINFSNEDEFHINLLQCRPLQISGLGKSITIPETLNPESLIFKVAGNFMGGNVSHKIDKLIYVDGHLYSELASKDRYMIARLIGKINNRLPEGTNIMLIGPGRWGTSTPSLGIPVSFSEISNVNVLVEVSFEESGLIPELSFGTHFFQDLVEAGTAYSAIFKEKEEVIFNTKFLDSSINSPKINEILGRFNNVVKVIDASDLDCYYISDVVNRIALCAIHL